MITYYYNINNIFKFSLSGPNKKTLDYLNKEYLFFKTDEKLQDIDLKVIIGKFKMSNDIELFSNSKYNIGYNFGWYYDSYKFVRYHIGMQDIDEYTTILYFSGGIFSQRLLQLKLLIPIIRYKLSCKGYAVIKSSSVGNSKYSYVFSAWSGGGKTSLMIYLISRGFNFYSDTFSIISKSGTVFPFPNMIHLFNRNIRSCPFIFKQLEFKKRISFRLKSLLHNFSLGFINLSQYECATDIYQNVKIGKPKPLQNLVFLTQSNNDNIVIEKSTDIMDNIKKLIQTNKFETNEFDQFSSVYIYKHPKSKLAGYWEREEDILLDAIKNSTSYFVKLPVKCGANEFEEIFKLLQIG